MKKLYRYNNFTNEGLFSKRKEPTFDDAINEIDKSFMIAIGFKGADRILKFISRFADIGEKLIKILENFGMNMTQEQMDEFIKRFNAFEKQCIGLGYRLTDYKSLIAIRNNENTLLDLLDHIKNIRDLEVNIKPEKFNNPLVFYKHQGFFYIVHKSWLEKRKKEEKEKHKGVDPYGEENWENESYLNESFGYRVCRRCKRNFIPKRSIGKMSKKICPECMDFIKNKFIEKKGKLTLDDIKIKRKICKADPYGEEDWGDEKNEGIKWYKKGEFEDDPNPPEIIEYEDFITDDRFRQFLIDEGAYEIFLKYAFDDVKNNFKRYSKFPDIIDLSLNWATTPTPGGGYDSAFWGDLNRKWVKIF